MDDSGESELYQRDTDAHRRLRSRRKRRRAYIRSIYLLPGMATLGNAVCGFAAIYILSLGFDTALVQNTAMFEQSVDPLTRFFYFHQAAAAAYLIFLAMVFDALDGRLARFTRHTTDFGGQLDSMADVISFGVAPAMLTLVICRGLPSMLEWYWKLQVPFFVTRAIWACAAVYACCAAIRLARFNVSNEHGEQHHFSFLGLPSPAAAGVVASTVLTYTTLFETHDPQAAMFAPGTYSPLLRTGMLLVLCALPLITLISGLLMVSTMRYPHIVNRFLRGRKSIPQLVLMIILGGVILTFHQYAIAAAMLAYALWGIVLYLIGRMKKGQGTSAAKGVSKA